MSPVEGFMWGIVVFCAIAAAANAWFGGHDAGRR